MLENRILFSRYSAGALASDCATSSPVTQLRVLFGGSGVLAGFVGAKQTRKLCFGLIEFSNMLPK